MSTDVVVKLIGLATAFVGVIAAVVGRYKMHVHRYEFVHLTGTETQAAGANRGSGWLSRIAWCLIGGGVLAVIIGICLAEDFSTTITRVDGDKVLPVKIRSDFNKTDEPVIKIDKTGTSKVTDEEATLKLESAFKPGSPKARIVTSEDGKSATVIEIFGGKKKKVAD